MEARLASIVCSPTESRRSPRRRVVNNGDSFYHQMWSDETVSHSKTRRVAWWLLLIAIVEALALAWLVGGMKW